VLALLILLAAAITANLWWIFENLRGMPFDIDAAGYLQRAVRDGDALKSGGIVAYVSAVRTRGDIQAPLLTALGGLFRQLGDFGVLKLTASLQLFYAITIVSTYSVARRVIDRRWSLVAALVVASLPAVLQASRNYSFGDPATALFLAALAVQMRSERFDRVLPSLAWGLLLGLCSLTRTVMLALLPALVLMGVPQLLTGTRKIHRLRNAGLGLGMCVAVAASWYTATWHAVFHYLVSYGYGSQAASYGRATSWLSAGHWTARLQAVANEDVFLPLSLALVGCAIVGTLCGAVRHHRRHHRLRSATEADPGTVGATASRATLAWLASDTGTLVGVLVFCYVVLSSTQNGGSYFELPMVPVIIILLTRLSSLATGKPAAVLMMSCLAAAGLTFANQAGWLLGSYSDVISVSVGSSHFIAFDTRGALIREASAAFGGCPGIYSCVSPQLRLRGISVGTHEDAAVNRYIRAWVPPVRDVTTFVETYAHAHDRDPIVFFAVQDPFFNTNTVALQAQLSYSSALPIGILNSPSAAGASYVDQLNEPRFGEPNFVVEGPRPENAYAAAFSPDDNQSEVVSVLRRDGFRLVDKIKLPDGRVLSLWWRNRGAMISR
jgi:4-amino-4-deoxy-L-arabinose transferase-like glycosyltransferase